MFFWFWFLSLFFLQAPENVSLSLRRPIQRERASSQTKGLERG